MFIGTGGGKSIVFPMSLRIAEKHRPELDSGAHYLDLG